MSVRNEGVPEGRPCDPWILLTTSIFLAALVVVAAIGPATSQAAFPGQDGRIFFVSDRDGNAEIYSMNSDGTDQRRLTSTSTDENQPSVSPNGRWVAFQSSAEGPSNQRIEIMRSNGTSLEVLARGSGVQSLEPSFHPSGEGILFVRVNPDGSREIIFLNLRDRGTFPVTQSGVTPQVAPSHPELLPNASRVIYQDLNGPIGVGTDQIFSIPPGDPFSQQLISSGSSPGTVPSVSPDSGSVIYTTFGGGTSKLLKTDLSSLTTQVVYSEANPFAVDMGVYSPSGTKVAYQKFSDGETSPFQIHVKSADDTAGGPVLTGPGSNNASPNWAPRTLTARFRTTTKPPARTAKRTAKFRFRAVTPGTRLTCQLDRKPVRQCPVGRTVTFKGLKRGKHRLRVTPYLVDQTARALGQASRVDGRVVKYRWKVR